MISFLLHCNASNLVFEVLKHDKIRGGETICISVSTPNSGGLVPCTAVISAHELSVGTLLVTHHTASRRVGNIFTSVCLSVCLSVGSICLD